MNSGDTLFERLGRFLADYFGLAELALEPSMTADDIEGWDSVSNIALMIALEEEFGMRFNTGEMASIENVGQLAERIAAAQERAGRARIHEEETRSR